MDKTSAHSRQPDQDLHSNSILNFLGQNSPENNNYSFDQLFIPQSGVSALAQILALSASIITAYLWLSIPFLEQYSLQVFAGCFLLYFVLKKINDSQIIEILPATAVDEMVLVVFAGLILIGSTQNTNSPFFPIIFVLLFLISMTMKFSTALVISLEFFLFFYANAAGLTQLNLSNLTSIPIVMTFFLFAKHQYQQAKENRTLVEIENNEIHNYQIFLEAEAEKINQLKENSAQISQYFVSFLKNYLQPKLIQVQNMVSFGQNSQAVKGQLNLINIQIEKVAAALLARQKNTGQQTTTQPSPDNSGRQS